MSTDLPRATCQRLAYDARDLGHTGLDLARLLARGDYESATRLADSMASDLDALRRVLTSALSPGTTPRPDLSHTTTSRRGARPGASAGKGDQ